MTTLREYFTPWRAEVFSCRCGWSGRSDAMNIEPFAELAQYACPLCDVHLILLSYPTEDDVREAAARGDEEAARMLRDRE